MPDPSLHGVLETCLYAEDLETAAVFYERILGLRPFARVEDRHVFFRTRSGVFLLFNPTRTSTAGGEVPAHGARGPGHVAFGIAAAEVSAWHDRLDRLGIRIEAQVDWPNGGSSLYLRDPAGNSVELATFSIWGLPDPDSGDHRDDGVTVDRMDSTGPITRKHRPGEDSMPTRKAQAVWQGGLPKGTGRFEGEGGAIRGNYTAGSRFGEDPGTNPEELLAAAHASCFSMALAGILGRAGYEPSEITTDAACTVEKIGEGYTITTMRLSTRADVPGIDLEGFRELANQAKDGCPVSRALTGLKVELDASLV